MIDAVGSGVGPGRSGQGGLLRRGQPGAHRRRPRHAADLRGLRAIGSGLGVGRVHRLRRHRVHGRRGPGSPGSSTSSRAASARPASSAPARSPIASSASRPASAPTTTSTAIVAWLRPVTDGNRCYLAVEEQTDGQQRPAGLPRGVRRAHRARPLPPAAAACSCRRSSTSSTAWPSTTSRSAQAPRLDLRAGLTVLAGRAQASAVRRPATVPTLAECGRDRTASARTAVTVAAHVRARHARGRGLRRAARRCRGRPHR